NPEHGCGSAGDETVLFTGNGPAGSPGRRRPTLDGCDAAATVLGPGRAGARDAARGGSLTRAGQGHHEPAVSPPPAPTSDNTAPRRSIPGHENYTRPGEQHRHLDAADSSCAVARFNAPGAGRASGKLRRLVHRAERTPVGEPHGPPRMRGRSLSILWGS